MTNILIICNHDLRDLYGLMLEIAGYLCDYAQNVQEALTIIRSKNIDLLMVDYHSDFQSEDKWTCYDVFEALKTEDGFSAMGKILWIGEGNMSDEGERKLGELLNSMKVRLVNMPVATSDLLSATEASLRAYHKPLMTRQERKINFERSKPRIRRVFPNWSDADLEKRHAELVARADLEN